MLKTILDYGIALTMLILCLPIIIAISVLIKLESQGPVFYRQERVGAGRKVFKIHKFRSMFLGADRSGLLTSGNSDGRVTKVGKYIRKFHLDELAQLVDVLQGNMSIVGPRPEVEEYTKIYRDKWDTVLKVKPGITGLAAVELSRWEYELLFKAIDKDETYKKIILPAKLDLEASYVKNQSLRYDIKIIYDTLKLLFN